MNAYPEKQQYTADDLAAIIAILRDPENGCPWDKVQTHTSIRMNFLEEAYEAVDAIDLDDPELMCEELGDVLMQVVFHAQIERETRGKETHFTYDIINGLIAATIYKVGDILTHYLTEHPEVDSPIHNRAEEYFRQFTELLGEHYKHERSVGFYARQLCITPKYLTTLIKRISGKSVSEWIDNYVILEAKTLLKYSNMSVQEIAYYLNFPNQSFFGSYFKRNAGMSPSQYKAKK